MGNRRRVESLPALFLCVGLIALAAGISFEGCGGKKTGDKLVFWEFWQSSLMEPLIREFERENPGIKVEMQQITWQNGLEKILAAVASGTAPDLCELGSTFFPRFASSGSLHEVGSDVDSLRDKLTNWELVTYDGKIYGIPWLVGTRAIFFNKTLLAKAGLDSTRGPETWQELVEIAKKIHDPAEGIYGFGLNSGERYVLFKKFMPFAWGNGGNVLTSDLKHSRLYSRENVEALKFYVSLKRCSVVERQEVLDRLFKEGRVGLILSGAWNLKTIPAEAPNLRFGVSIVPKPGIEKGTHASFAGGEILAVFESSKKKDDALRLACFLARKKNALAISKSEHSVQPAVAGIDTDEYFVKNPLEGVFAEQLKYAVSTPNIPNWLEIEGVVEDAVEEALHGRKTPDEALRTAGTKIEQLLTKPDSR
ncbi:MAG: extracellular solute-binding protein [Candidatus Eisenbacteria bacterium]|nr:extracellular solute-binding protein [Candidatus Eisenbacteria bacterium]